MKEIEEKNFKKLAMESYKQALIDINKIINEMIQNSVKLYDQLISRLDD